MGAGGSCVGGARGCISAASLEAARARAARVGTAVPFLAAAVDIVGEHTDCVRGVPARRALLPLVPASRDIDSLPAEPPAEPDCDANAFIARSIALCQRGTPVIDGRPEAVAADFAKRFAGTCLVQSIAYSYQATELAASVVARAVHDLARILPPRPRAEFLACWRLHQTASSDENPAGPGAAVIAAGAARLTRHLLERELILRALDFALEAKLAKKALSKTFVYTRRGEIFFFFEVPGDNPSQFPPISRVLFKYMLLTGDRYTSFSRRVARVPGGKDALADYFQLAHGVFTLPRPLQDSYVGLSELVRMLAEASPASILRAERLNHMLYSDYAPVRPQSFW